MSQSILLFTIRSNDLPKLKFIGYVYDDLLKYHWIFKQLFLQVACPS